MIDKSCQTEYLDENYVLTKLMHQDARYSVVINKIFSFLQGEHTHQGIKLYIFRHWYCYCFPSVSKMQKVHRRNQSNNKALTEVRRPRIKKSGSWKTKEYVWGYKCWQYYFILLHETPVQLWRRVRMGRQHLRWAFRWRDYRVSWIRTNTSRDYKIWNRAEHLGNYTWIIRPKMFS